jgi:CRISPR/Cas system-associated protein Cas5 (RAMP superfamily)
VVLVLVLVAAVVVMVSEMSEVSEARRLKCPRCRWWVRSDGKRKVKRGETEVITRWKD